MAVKNGIYGDSLSFVHALFSLSPPLSLSLSLAPLPRAALAAEPDVT